MLASWGPSALGPTPATFAPRVWFYIRSRSSIISIHASPRSCHALRACSSLVVVLLIVFIVLVPLLSVAAGVLGFLLFFYEMIADGDFVQYVTKEFFALTYVSQCAKNAVVNAVCVGLY